MKKQQWGVMWWGGWVSGVEREILDAMVRIVVLKFLVMVDELRKCESIYE